MLQLNETIDAQIEFQSALAKNLAMYYEQYILMKIDLDKFRIRQ